MKTSFQHILVPVDFSEKNLAAMEVASQIAKENPARITLLHVIEFIDFPEDDEIKNFYEKLRKRSEAEFEKLLQQVDVDQFDVTVDTIVNHRSKGVVLYAADNDVDLIVMSSHAFHPQQSSEGWGTISYQVAALCQCSIMLIK
jgi:nucleotide-binding universal stress UspA family protein